MKKRDVVPCQMMGTFPFSKDDQKRGEQSMASEQELAFLATVKDEDVYPYRMKKELQSRAHCNELRAADTSVKRSVRTEVGWVDLYFYYPEERTSDVVVFDFHGGGFCLGYWELDIPYCRLMADLSGAVVVNVDYPCSPEHKYPLSYTCSYEAMLWCHEHADELGIARGRFMTVGSSAGGNLACAIVQLAAERGDFPIVGFAMNYPVLRMSFSREAPDPTKAIANERSLQYIAWEYADLAQMTEPLASPTEAGPDMQWPDMLLNVAGYDSLKDEADDFRDKLVMQGVHVDYKNYPEAMHGFTHEDLREYRADDAHDAWERIARFIRRH